VVFWHYTVVVAVYCFSALLFDKHTVVFTLCACGGFFYTFCIVITDVYYYCLCQVLHCWQGCSGPELGWVRFCHLVGQVLVGAGWDGLL